MKVLELNNISFAYSKSEPIISDFSEIITRGERIKIIGPNGSGKTTLIKLMSQCLLPQSGTVTIFDNSIGLLLSGAEGFFPNLTGLENLKLFSNLLNKPLNNLEKWNKLPVFNRATQTTFKKCSQGMKKILSLHKAFLGASDLVFLDEPFNYLDTETQQWLVEHLTTFEGTLVVSSHIDFSLKGREICLKH